MLTSRRSKTASAGSGDIDCLASIANGTDVVLLGASAPTGLKAIPSSLLSLMVSLKHAEPSTLPGEQGPCGQVPDKYQHDQHQRGPPGLGVFDRKRRLGIAEDVDRDVRDRGAEDVERGVA